MASHHHLLKHDKPRESPAKVFAKLKSKVQREEMRLGAESTWMSQEHKENHRFALYRNEAQALTLSPIKSPQKTFRDFSSDLSSRPVEELPGHVTLCSLRKRGLLESTAVSQSFSVINRQQIHTEPPQLRGLDGFKMISRTPVKVDSDCVFEEDCVPLDKLRSPAFMFSPMRKRLKKREWEPQEERTTSGAFRMDDTYAEELGCDRRFSADRPEANQLTHEPMLPPRSAIKREMIQTSNVAALF